MKASSKWCVLSNLPGCLPALPLHRAALVAVASSHPDVFDTKDEAKRALIGTLLQAEHDADTEEEAKTWRMLAEDVNVGYTGVYGPDGMFYGMQEV